MPTAKKKAPAKKAPAKKAAAKKPAAKKAVTKAPAKKAAAKKPAAKKRLRKSNHSCPRQVLKTSWEKSSGFSQFVFVRKSPARPPGQ